MIHSHPIASSVDSSIMTSSSSSTPTSPIFPRFPQQQLRTSPYSEPIQSEASKRRVRFTFGYDEEDTQSSSDQGLPPLPSYTEAVTATTTTGTRPNHVNRSPSPSYPSMRIISPSAYDTLLASDNDTPTNLHTTTDTTVSTPIMNSTTTTTTNNPNINDPTHSHSTHPSLSDLVSPIPLRTSSMTSSSSSTFIPSSRTHSPRNSSETLPPPSSSRCSSMNSAVSATWSLDHRTMPRTPVSATKRPASSASSASFSSSSRTPLSSRSNEKALPSLPPDSNSDQLTQRRPSVAERTAFLASPPVRSRVSSRVLGKVHYHQQSFARSTPSLPARFKNMSPVSPSSFSFSSSTARATVSSPTLSLSTFSAMHLPLSMSRPIRTTVPLEKRRWSNDSTRGIHGLAFLEGEDPEEGSVGSSSFLEDEDEDDDNDGDAENAGDCDFKKAHSVHGYSSYTKKKTSSKPKKTKKKCIVLSTFESLLKKQ